MKSDKIPIIRKLIGEGLTSLEILQRVPGINYGNVSYQRRLLGLPSISGLNIQRRTEDARKAREQYIKSLRQEGKTLQQIAFELGVSKQRVSQMGDYTKHRARSLLIKAVIRGDILRPDTCNRCGVNGGTKIEAHHIDYSRPFAVQWLCKKCHTASTYPPTA